MRPDGWDDRQGRGQRVRVSTDAPGSWPHRLSARSEGAGRPLTGFRYCKEFNDRGVECNSDAFQHGNRRIFAPPLQAAYVGTIDPGIDSQVFLRDAACHPEATNIACDERAGVHARNRSSWSLSNHGL
jgi:hypothetical protein